jgi:hypothetical protein
MIVRSSKDTDAAHDRHYRGSQMNTFVQIVSGYVLRANQYSATIIKYHDEHFTRPCDIHADDQMVHRLIKLLSPETTAWIEENRADTLAPEMNARADDAEDDGEDDAGAVAELFDADQDGDRGDDQDDDQDDDREVRPAIRRRNNPGREYIADREAHYELDSRENSADSGDASGSDDLEDMLEGMGMM